MKRITFIKKMKELGYEVGIRDDGITIGDGFGFRLFVSDKMERAMNTMGAVTLPKTEYDIANRYVRTPIEKR